MRVFLYSNVAFVLGYVLCGPAYSACLKGSYTGKAVTENLGWNKNTGSYSVHGKSERETISKDLTGSKFCVENGIFITDLQNVRAPINAGKTTFNDRTPQGYPVEYMLNGSQKGDVFTLRRSFTILAGSKSNNKNVEDYSVTFRVKNGQCTLLKASYRSTKVFPERFISGGNIDSIGSAPCEFD